MRTFPAYLIFFLLIATSCTKQNTIVDPGAVQSLSIPNGDFEIWNSRPCIVQWTTNSIPERLPPYDPYIIKQDSVNVYHGKYSAKFIFNGVDRAYAEIKIPTDLHPASLNAWVKSQMLDEDSVFVGVFISKGSVIADSGVWWGTTSISSYKKLNIPITKTATKSDTVCIRIMGGNKGSKLDTNSVFWIDYLSFQF